MTDTHGQPAPEIGASVTGHAHLPEATLSTTVEVPPGESFDLHVRPVSKRISGTALPMLSYNGSIPGPTLRVKQGSEVLVNVSNETEILTTVHWHGLRLENEYDGVPHQTQAPIAPGSRYTHRLSFPDPGLYWYHPHVREDYQQELGLYGNVIVEPADPLYWPTADRDVVLTLDDILIEDGRIAAFDPHGANYTAMGRFGNVLLIGGQTAQQLEIGRGEVVRFLLTNTANTRVFNVALPGPRMKLIGGDSGRYEREEWVDHVVVAPSERAILDVKFDDVGAFALQHVTPGRVYELVNINVVDRDVAFHPQDFEHLRVNADILADRRHAERYLDAPPDKTLALVAEMDFDEPDTTGPLVYVCPMHPQVVEDQPGSCPVCGMKLMPQTAPVTSYACPMHPEIVRDGPGSCPICGMKLMPSHQIAAAIEAADAHGPATAPGHHHDHADAMADGIEWEDLMPEVNRTTTTANMRWKLVDRDTGAANDAIRWDFVAGDQVKIRLVNEMESDHPMHHPFHIHGERFLILARDGVPEPNLVWKDTVLIRTGQTVDILMDASNPGLWMAHCHIAEHMETGMMFSFRVRDAAS
ncbi:MAG TPA: multicopper oxidase family protein [Jiangellaceae bacterium]|nr:multicopper oxidase family protein [Jiangellaceae bacterium]